jgi:3-phosphoshikimate 1-carboxyvinyltransferase
MDLLRYKQLHVHPAQSLRGTLTPPASKSSSTRSVLAATLSTGTSRVDNVAQSHNVRAMVDACRALGAEIAPSGTGITITGPGELTDGLTLSPGNSGIVLRLLMGATARLRRVTFETPYLQSLGGRANSEMVQALRDLGVKVTAAGEDGCLPITLDGSHTHGGEIRISGRRSSQFLSGLLYLGGLLEEPLTITVTDELKAKPMVQTTIDVLSAAGVSVTASQDMLFYVTDPSTSFKPAHYTVGSDPASTAAVLAIASAVESDVEFSQCRLEELGGVLEYLQEIGVSVAVDGSSLRVRGGGDLKPLDFDGSKAPDAVLPLAALAAHASGTSRFYNIEHLRYKECDRISDFRAELLKAGVSADEKHDELIIHGNPKGVEGGVAVDSHYDHGVILAMSLVALRSQKGLLINDPQYVGQTFPKFFEDMQSIGASVTATA